MGVEKEPISKLVHEGIRFTTVQSDMVEIIARDGPASDAVAIWLYLCGKPESWSISETNICGTLNIGRRKYQNAMRRLKEVGLVRTTLHHGEGGRIVDRTLTVVNAIMPGSDYCNKINGATVSHKSELTADSTVSHVFRRTVNATDGKRDHLVKKEKRSKEREEREERESTTPPSPCSEPLTENTEVVQPLPENPETVAGRGSAPPAPPPAIFPDVFPDNLNQSAWREWVAYKTETSKPLTHKGTITKNINLLAGFSFDAQQHMVDYSIGGQHPAIYKNQGEEYDDGQRNGRGKKGESQLDSLKNIAAAAARGEEPF